MAPEPVPGGFRLSLARRRNSLPLAKPDQNLLYRNLHPDRGLLCRGKCRGPERHQANLGLTLRFCVRRISPRQPEQQDQEWKAHRGERTLWRHSPREFPGLVPEPDREVPVPSGLVYQDLSGCPVCLENWWRHVHKRRATSQDCRQDQRRGGKTLVGRQPDLWGGPDQESYQQMVQSLLHVQPKHLSELSLWHSVLHVSTDSRCPSQHVRVGAALPLGRHLCHGYAVPSRQYPAQGSLRIQLSEEKAGPLPLLTGGLFSSSQSGGNEKNVPGVLRKAAAAMPGLLPKKIKILHGWKMPLEESSLMMGFAKSSRSLTLNEGKNEDRKIDIRAVRFGQPTSNRSIALVWAKLFAVFRTAYSRDI